MKTAGTILGLWLLGTGMLLADMNDNPFYVWATVDRLETTDDAQHPAIWEGAIRMGGERNRIVFYSEGEALDGEVDEFENELVYSRAIAPFWDLQIGIAQDMADSERLNWGKIALEGMAPYFVEMRIALLGAEDGNIGVRMDAEYEAYLTQMLVLVPSIETALYTKNTSKMALGKGLSSLRAGVRLHYFLRRDFAPYVGAEWEKHYGETGRFAPLDRSHFIVGLHGWW